MNIALVLSLINILFLYQFSHRVYNYSFFMGWSPQAAMKAYLSTLNLLNIHTLGSTILVAEPKYTEFISALAAGSRAKLMVEIASKGVTPLTMALAVAASQTGGQLVCIFPSHEDVDASHISQLTSSDVKFIIGNPSEVVKQFKNIDFVVIDSKLEHQFKLFKTIDVNPKGSMVVVTNLVGRRENLTFGEVVNRRKGVDSVTRLIGGGIELTKIGSLSKCESKKYKRFYVTFEN